ncbi:MAG TPA: bifunctional precorrin-2 dehydrogenase/sirohydrochlorin ferrochelatase [Deltaproteobacteria bacterium]|mgnify:CR=1 FL=1|nr:bifunctional precorrin-2 dehydrogenase/sirohydrochlorin ferrochelatase [Deltaproteobacteria bacterium]
MGILCDERILPVEYYPVSLDIRKKRCVVVGGGDVAERKVERLLACGAEVSVVGMELTSTLDALARDKKICHIVDTYKREYIEGAFLVIGATDDDEVNGQVATDSRWNNIWVNIVDDPARCDFIVPSVLRQGDLTIAISTGGKSPALAKQIREELETKFGPEYGILLMIMGMIREKITARGAPSDMNKKLFESVLNSHILDCIRNRDWEQVKTIIEDTVGESLDVEVLSGGRHAVCR